MLCPNHPIPPPLAPVAVLVAPAAGDADHLVAPPASTVGYVHSVETCGSVDGPGMRYVVFLPGCPLACQYCHNPDTRFMRFAKRQSAEEVIADVLRYKNFLRRGGLTLSGGEPLAQPRFTHALLAEAKKHDLHTALDTSGYLGNKASDALLEATDLVLLDIKSSEPSLYKKVTGVDLQPTLDFARRLDQLGKPVWIRFVLVPGLTDDPNNIRGLAGLISELSNVERIEILPFHKMGEAKYAKLGLAYALGNTPAANEGDVDRARALFAEFHLSTT
ncbi:MAG: pyruvate formate-lyase-activating protein [Verrucomicrobiales bacterium]